MLMVFYFDHLFQGIILVYDITDEKSFENIQNWMKGIKEVREKGKLNLSVIIGVLGSLQVDIVHFKGEMCKNFEYLLTEMEYDIHNNVFSGV